MGIGFGGNIAHKNTHKTGGNDPITPADIGAANAASEHTHSNSAALDLIGKDGSNKPTWNGGAWPGGSGGGTGTVQSIEGITPNAGGNIDIAGGTGITVTTDQNTNKVVITATGTAAPGAHNQSHFQGGADPIAPGDIGAQTHSSALDLIGKDGGNNPTWNGGQWPGDNTGKQISFCIPGDSFVATKQAGILIQRACTILKVSAYADNMPTGADLVVDLIKNGSTIWTNQNNRVRILNSTNAAADVTTFDVSSLAAGDRLTLDIDQVGSVQTGGNNLYVTVVIA